MDCCNELQLSLSVCMRSTECENKQYSTTYIYITEIGFSDEMSEVLDHGLC